MRKGKITNTNLCLRIFVILVFLIFFQGCKRLQNPSSLSLEDVFVFVECPLSLPADGVSKTKIKISLEGDTPDGEIVKFQTDNGRFASISGSSSVDKPQEIEVKAAGRLVEVYLISSTEVRDATVSAAIGDFKQFITIPFTRYLPERILLSTNKSVIKCQEAHTFTN